MNIQDAQNLLPKVGDKMRKAPTLVGSTGLTHTAEVQECEVVEVNPRGLWYRVQFENGGTECYKVPKLKDAKTGGARV